MYERLNREGVEFLVEEGGGGGAERRNRRRIEGRGGAGAEGGGIEEEELISIADRHRGEVQTNSDAVQEADNRRF